MIQRKTQDPAYWDEQFTITPEDLQHLSTLLVDDELPRSAEELGRALVLQRSRQEEATIKRALGKGAPYQPKQSYEVGQQVVFPNMGYRAGEVTGLRPGRNPEYDEFQVIQVRFENGEEHEFAAEFKGKHVLNAEIEVSETIIPPEELAQMYGPQVGKKLEHHLEANPTFVRLAGKWFRRDLLVEVHEGHLNLAEAVLDVANGGPLPTEALLGDVELPEEISPQLRVFSLNYALQKDERFDEVGPAGEVMWFLHRLEPEAVLTTPQYLRYRPIKYTPALLTSEMHSLVEQLDDEWSKLEPPPTPSNLETIVLTYPHWRSGTLPISSNLSKIFPTGHTERIRFTFVDGDTGEEMPGWTIRKERYVYGLEEWYRKNNIPVGTYLELSPGAQKGQIFIQPRSRRSRREWVRVAFPKDGRLTFEMHRERMTCEYDELMVIATGPLSELDTIRQRTQEQGITLRQLVDEIFPELVKLSPQGNVHAATLYSAVNVAMRTPPGPMLARLVENDKYAPVGDNYWVLHTGPGGE